MKKNIFFVLTLLSAFLFPACSSSDMDTNNGGTGNNNPDSGYTVPAYEDYYVSISDWNNRAKWNLANVHDPSVVLADDGYYYMYQTDASYGNVHYNHGHFFCRRSKDLVNWDFLGATMHGIPSWVKTKLNEIRSNMGLGASTADFNDQTQFGFWAPCVRRISSNLYRMYYVITIPGTIDGNGTWSERCFIGLMETSTPADIDSWKDKGYVITNYSDKQLNFHVGANDWNNCYFKYNAIDPSLIITDNGENWLIYGSWHSGIAAVQLNPSTGMPLKELGNPWGDENASAYGKTIYNRFLGEAGQRWQGSEAPEVVYYNGYYYLFLAYDELSVAYNTRVVRSKNIDGPYYDITGRNVTSEGGEIYPVVTHPYKFGNDHGWVGISHCAVFDDGKGNWYYASQQRFPANFKDNTSSNALMVGGIRSIVWTSTGWPLVMPERYGAVPQKAITESELVGNWQHINLVYNYQKQDASTTMVLGSDHKVKSGWNVGSTWSFDAVSSVLTIDTVKLYLKREVDWEVSPRKVTIVYAGYSPAGTTTYWGKHVSENN
ncbi:MAG TPA: arabinan endo-1,5-alpha-L-arabinosidase [Prevotella sp.]|nr:arabinan endo-1,5-alpha-L-arabinosidase [Prevotella sp.]